MIGIIPGIHKTFIVDDYFCETPTEGNLYVDPDSKRVFMYSKVFKRSSAENGFFPVWDGQKKIITPFSNNKTLENVIDFDIAKLSSKIDSEKAEQILIEQRKHNSGVLLEPVITNDDNLFTKCIKGTILNLKLSFDDLIEMSYPKLNEKMLNIYYSSLNKTAFMRLNKWHVWVTTILSVGYRITVFDRENSVLVSYEFPSGVIAGVNEKLIKSTNCSDPLKQIVKILILLLNISKEQFKTDAVDEYTINNLFTVIGNNKPMSGQIFSRFIILSDLMYQIEVIKDGEVIYSFKE